MTKRLVEREKFDVALVPQSLNGNASGRYYPMSMYRKALAVLNVATMAAAATAKVEFLQATDVSGAGAKGIPSDAGQLATATITANTKATVVQCVVGAPANGDKVTLNGIDFTKAAATDAATRAFADAAGLETCVNDAAKGVPGVKATNSAGTIAFTAIDPGETVITAANTGAALTVSTLQAQAYVELDVSQLDLANGFEFIAAKVTTSAAIVVGTVLVRGDGRFYPDQKMAAGAAI